MNTKKFFKWSLILMAFVAYKQIEGVGGNDPRQDVSYVTYQSSH